MCWHSHTGYLLTVLTILKRNKHPLNKIRFDIFGYYK